MVAAAALWLLPGSAIDRAAFSAAVRSVANPPYFITGSGKPEDPWKLRTLSARPAAAPEAPPVVALGDDPDGFFQSSPAAPIDIAVVLRNFQRLGADKAALGVVLAWDQPDPMGLAALDNVLGRFSSLAMCAPLGRGAVPDPLPAAFRRASVAAADITGSATLPVVNRISVPGVILGETAEAGFQSLDSEPSTDWLPLLARWDDRVVLGFPLLAAMQRLDVPVGKLEIRLGKYLRLGNDGPVLPVDARGRIAVSSLRRVVPEVVRDRDTIDRAEPLDTGGGQVLFRDDRSSADDATRRFSRLLAPAVAALSARDALSAVTGYPRLRPAAESGLLALAVVAAVLAAMRQGMSRGVLLSLLGAGILVVQLLGFGVFHHWLPGLPALAATAVAAIVAWMPARGPEKEKPDPAPPVAPEPPPEAAPATPEPEATPEPPAAPAKKKRATKKQAAKKTTARKTPARKTAPKKPKK